MSDRPLDQTLSLDAGGEVWALLVTGVDRLRSAWNARGGPPDLAPLLPEDAGPARWLVLVEMVKVDLGLRWQRPEWHKPLEQYLAEFPELADDGEPPADVIYEEYYVRQRAGEEINLKQFLVRFPRRGDDVRRMIEANPAASTTLQGRQPPEFDVGVEDRLDDFDLLARLGKGAFASVFLARQRSLGRLVALKVSADRGYETQTLAQLDHPYIVRVHDQRLLPERKLRLMYMQYVAGGTLQGVVDRVRRTAMPLRRGSMLVEAVDGSLNERGESPPTDSRARQLLARMSWPEVVCWLGTRLAAALAYAHEKGVLHRDLKPANVLVAADCTPKLADFNISANAKLEGVTAAAYFGGSLAYMSPEQLEACDPEHERQPEDLDGRSDVYSLGVLLWELLSGRRPFSDESICDLSSRSLSGLVSRRRAGVDRVAMEQLPSDCPPGLVEVLLTCLQANPNDRFAGAAPLARQLELCLQPRVQRLLRPSSGGWQAFLRRHPLVALFIAGVLPNVVCSGLNIAYNVMEILKQSGSSEVWDVFQVQLMTINPIAYAVGIVVIIRLAWPMLRAVVARQRSSLAGPLLEQARARSMWLGDYVAWTSAAEWCLSGVAFPLWMRLSLAADAGLHQRHLIHFLTSQLLCGLMAATLSFFSVTLVSMRMYCPVLLDPDVDDHQTFAGLMALVRRTPVYTYLALTVFPLALIVMPVVGTDSQQAFMALGIVGMVASAWSFVLSRTIQRLATTLGTAASSEGRGLLTESADSFWTQSR